MKQGLGIRGKLRKQTGERKAPDRVAVEATDRSPLLRVSRGGA